MRKTALLVFLVCLCTSCSRGPDRAEVVGVYLLDKSGTTYKLELNGDGTYVHTFVGNDGKVSSKVGSWDWDAKEVDNEIALHDFVEFPGEDIGAVVPSIYCTSPSSSWDGIKLRAGGDPDSPMHYFVKQRQD